ncbi:glycosyltransferase [Hungatella hathewayi]|uniref:glycosyltransferase n=1 Tax=Hungatella hathewayi TaxID=154046 RepID=UPI0035642FC2
MDVLNCSSPLVSVMIPNYNHSKYLEECIESALNQTYKNLEIVVLDNASEDSSVELISKYVDRGVRVCRNAVNVLNRSYIILSEMLTSGKYMILLCADDYIEPDFIKAAVELMEQYPNVGYVQGERDFITEEGKRLSLEPFYNCSFIAPGKNTMPLYMVTTVAHPSQTVFRREAFLKIGGYDMEISHMNADRALWFYLSFVSDCAYLRKKMACIRIGKQTETVYTLRNFQHLILSHMTIKDFLDFAEEKGLDNVLMRKEEAFKRLASDFLNYAAAMLLADDFYNAERCLLYCRVVYKKITDSELYMKLDTFIKQGKVDKQYLEQKDSESYQHKRNYNPPEGYMLLEDVRERA